MALRVLLADESSTIKKVFQLALQDFAVDVRPVNVGVDVVPVAQNFKPDIIFADVLLQKKNGYDVCLEVKDHAQLKHTPVVLMWSGFMELDEDKFQACKANAQLEKPFDVAALRKLVTDLVPRTQNQRISQFLSFPKMPDLEEGAPQAPSVPPPELPDGDLVEEEFQQIPLPKMKSAANDKFRVELSPEELEPDHVPVQYDVPGEESDDFAFKEPRAQGHGELGRQIELNDEAIMPPPPMPAPTMASGLSEPQLEKLVREQAAKMIESVVWKVVPELAAQIIERELNKLLKERDSHPY